MKRSSSKSRFGSSRGRYLAARIWSSSVRPSTACGATAPLAFVVRLPPAAAPRRRAAGRLSATGWAAACLLVRAVRAFDFPAIGPIAGAEAGRTRRAAALSAAASTATAFTGVAFLAGAPFFAVATRLRAAAGSSVFDFLAEMAFFGTAAADGLAAADRGGAEAPRVVRGDSSLAAGRVAPDFAPPFTFSLSRPTKRARPPFDRRPPLPATRLCRRAARQSPSFPPSSCCWP